MDDVLVCSVRTICPNCQLSYQRPITAKELMAGGGPKLIECEYCREVADSHNSFKS